MLDRVGYFRRWAELHGGYDPARHTPARIWLGLVYAVARRCGPVPPSAVTAAGVLVAAAVPALAALGVPFGAAAAVALSGFLDSLDGAVAIGRGRDSRWGFVLDSVADRMSDVAYVSAFWVLGAPGWLCAVAAGVSTLQEYLRARAAAAGMAEIGVVTIFERPTRILLAGLVLLGVALPGVPVAPVVGVAAGAWAGLALVGFGQLTVAVRRALS